MRLIRYELTYESVCNFSFMLHHRLALSTLAYPFAFSSSGSLFVRQNKYITKCTTELSSLFYYLSNTHNTLLMRVCLVFDYNFCSFSPKRVRLQTFTQSLKRPLLYSYKKSPASLSHYCAWITELDMLLFTLSMHYCTDQDSEDPCILLIHLKKQSKRAKPGFSYQAFNTYYS